MANTVTRDPHLLSRNLKLSGNYISNDGGDEGITVDNDGIVTMSSQLDIGNMSLTTSEIDISAGDLTVDVEGDITLDAAGGNIILHTPTSVGRIDVSSTGVNMYSSDVRTLHLNQHTPLISFYSVLNPDDYARIQMAANGAMTITTHDDVGTLGFLKLNADGYITLDADGDITLDAAGDIILDADGDQVSMKFGATAGQIDFSNENSGDGIIRQMVDTKDLVIQQFDGSEVIRIADDRKLYFYDKGGEHISSDGTDLTIASGNDCTIDADGDIILDSAETNAITQFQDSGSMYASFQSLAAGDITTLKLYESPGNSDYFAIQTVTAGATTISTLDGAGADAHLTIAPDGHAEFDGCGVGFDKISYTDDTNVTVDFTTGNKAELDMAGGSISGTLSLKFPDTSGNFLLVVKQDGSTRTIAAFATLDSGGNAGDNDGGTGGAIRWAGGSAPDLTDGSNKDDILTFYWDADLEVCYGVATLNF